MNRMVQDGSGWCAYDDWMLGLRRLRRATNGRVKQAIYIDLDVHQARIAMRQAAGYEAGHVHNGMDMQGNGVARDKLHFEDDLLYILDMYNCDIWPNDRRAKRGIDCEEGFSCGCTDAEYLRRLESALQRSFINLSPDIVMYNAGTDILDGDPLGRCKVHQSHHLYLEILHVGILDVFRSCMRLFAADLGRRRHEAGRNGVGYCSGPQSADLHDSLRRFVLCSTL